MIVAGQVGQQPLRGAERRDLVGHRQIGDAQTWTAIGDEVLAPRQSRTGDQTPAADDDTGTTRVLRNTYLLLSMTLMFSAVTAGISMVLKIPYMGLLMLLPYIVLLVMVEKTKESAAGIGWVFALTGWLFL